MNVAFTILSRRDDVLVEPDLFMHCEVLWYLIGGYQCVFAMYRSFSGSLLLLNTMLMYVADFCLL